MSTFYICATPIGNLDDISKRLVDTLNSVDIVYAEDTRRGKKLLSHLDIKKPIYSYFVGNEKSKSNEILKQIKEGKSIALISDAGTPLISDPGEYLVRTHKEQCRYICYTRSVECLSCFNIIWF